MSALVLTVPNSSISESELPKDSTKLSDQDENRINACSADPCLGLIWNGLSQ